MQIYFIIGIVAISAIICFIIIEILNIIKPKSNQFTMKNPPKPPLKPINRAESRHEIYCELNRKRIGLLTELNIVNYEIKELLKSEEVQHRNNTYKSNVRIYVKNLNRGN